MDILHQWTLIQQDQEHNSILMIKTLMSLESRIMEDKADLDKVDMEVLVMPAKEILILLPQAPKPILMTKIPMFLEFKATVKVVTDKEAMGKEVMDKEE